MFFSVQQRLRIRALAPHFRDIAYDAFHILAIGDAVPGLCAVKDSYAALALFDQRVYHKRQEIFAFEGIFLQVFIQPCGEAGSKLGAGIVGFI